MTMKKERKLRPASLTANGKSLSRPVVTNDRGPRTNPRPTRSARLTSNDIAHRTWAVEYDEPTRTQRRVHVAALQIDVPGLWRRFFLSRSISAKAVSGA